MRIAYFGGAFDPPHAGHLAGARAMLKSGAADRVWLAPSYAPPHKNGGGMAGFADRVAMLKRLTAGEPAMAVSEAEREISVAPSYTFDVLTELSSRHPQDQFLLLIGGDSLLYLQDWHRGRELAEKFEVWTWPRPGAAFSAAKLAAHWPAQLAEKLAGRCLAGNLVDVSSTALRIQLMTCGNVPEELLPAAVAEYIREKHLYRGDAI